MMNKIMLSTSMQDGRRNHKSKSIRQNGNKLNDAIRNSHLSSLTRPNNNQFSTISYKCACKLDASRSKTLTNDRQINLKHHMIFFMLERAHMKSEIRVQIFFGKQHTEIEAERDVKSHAPESHISHTQ
jgi:hypothetical protein